MNVFFSVRCLSSVESANTKLITESPMINGITLISGTFGSGEGETDNRTMLGVVTEFTIAELVREVTTIVAFPDPRVSDAAR